jgi:hypothetical protein
MQPNLPLVPKRQEQDNEVQELGPYGKALQLGNKQEGTCAYSLCLVCLAVCNVCWVESCQVAVRLQCDQQVGRHSPCIFIMCCPLPCKTEAQSRCEDRNTHSCIQRSTFANYCPCFPPTCRFNHEFLYKYILAQSAAEAILKFGMGTARAALPLRVPVLAHAL